MKRWLVLLFLNISPLSANDANNLSKGLILLNGEFAASEEEVLNLDKNQDSIDSKKLEEMSSKIEDGVSFDQRKRLTQKTNQSVQCACKKCGSSTGYWGDCTNINCSEWGK